MLFIIKNNTSVKVYERVIFIGLRVFSMYKNTRRLDFLLCFIRLYINNEKRLAKKKNNISPDIWKKLYSLCSIVK